MYNIYNFTEEGARGGEIITDKANPSLTISNVSLGVGLSIISTVTTAISVVADVGALGSTTSVSAAVKFVAASTTANVLSILKNVVASPTVALMYFGPASAASSPVFEFTATGGFVSAGSIDLLSPYGGIRVKIGDSFGWIPVVANGGMKNTSVA